MKTLKMMVAIAGSFLLMTAVAEACGHDKKTCGHQNISSDGAKACAIGHHAGSYFISPKDGETVSSTVKIKMGVYGMKVHKAGDLIEGTGHHHLIIDGAFVPETAAVPNDARHIHFGKGQTEAEIKLKKGKHTLTLQFADGYHQSYGKVFSRTIQVTVK